MAKDTYLKKVLGKDRYQRIRNAKILMVGAGGIGCELIKDLILTGYGEIHIVDLDTITLSNLNRQFLFRQKDIDHSKSLTVVEAVKTFNYFGTKLVPHHGNIMDTKQFPINWWSQFSYIFNALDNLEARRYVNRMSLFLKKPLMESGTTGFDGQIQPIFPYTSECFECQAKATPKTYPVCTIRSTPSQPVHCITWAKEFLFQQLFDESKSDINEQSLQSETDDKKEIENILKESNELNDLRRLILESDESTFFNELITKIFKVDIERLLEIDSLWKSRVKPSPLEIEDYKEDLNSILSFPNNEDILKADTKLWTILENLYVLYISCGKLQSRLKGSEPFITFDKDDEDTMNFVVAAANLRSFIFSIETKTKFDIKQIAGNIIPAIATTNAVISGFSSLGGYGYFGNAEVTDGNFDKIYKESSTVFISIRPNKYVTAAPLIGPNKKCASCSLSSRGLLSLSEFQLNEYTLQDLIDQILKKYHYDEISLILGKTKLIYDFDFDSNVDKRLSEINGFHNGEILLIQDEDDALENLELYINVVEESQDELLPSLTLRPKQVFENDKEQNVTEKSDELNTAETITIDEDEGDGLIEIEEPAPKKRRIE